MRQVKRRKEKEWGTQRRVFGESGQGHKTGRLGKTWVERELGDEGNDRDRRLRE